MVFFLGLIVVAVGFFLVARTNSIVAFFGRIAFFDRYLGAEGGTRLGYKLIGLFAIFIGVLMMTGLIEGFMMWVLSPLLGKMGPAA